MPTKVNRPIRALQERIVEDLKLYRRTDRDGQTPILRRLASAFVEARQHFLTAEGEPDWLGKSYAYRQWTRECYDEASFDGEMRRRVQQTIRFHAGTVLREQLSDDQLEDLGLRSYSPREASTQRRQSRAAMLKSLTAQQDPGSGLRAILGAQGLLNAVDPPGLRSMSEDEQMVAKNTARAIRRKADAILRALG